MKAFTATLLTAASAVDLQSNYYGKQDLHHIGASGFHHLVNPDYNFFNYDHTEHDTRTIKCPEGQVFGCEYDYKHYGVYGSSDHDDVNDSDVNDYIYRNGYGGVDLTDSDSDFYYFDHYNHYSFSDDDQGYYGFSASDDDYYYLGGVGDLGYRYEGPDFSNAYGGQPFYRVVICDEKNANCRNEYRPGGYADHGGYEPYAGKGHGYGGLGGLPDYGFDYGYNGLASYPNPHGYPY